MAIIMTEALGLGKTASSKKRQILWRAAHTD
jgi:hypothetical protein